jgi:hypothetical protein
MTQFDLIKKMNLSLLELGIKGIQKMYKLEPQIFSYAKIKDTFNANGYPNMITSEMDTNYAFLEIGTIQPLVLDTMDLIHKFTYKYDYTDCDNFAFLTSALFSFLYGINTIGVCWGNIYNKDTGAFIAAHYFNILITYNNTKKIFELWLMDSLNPGITKIEKDVPLIIGNWKYKNLTNVKYF